MQWRRFLRDIFVSCLFVLLVLEGGGSLYATEQADDRFVYKGKEYRISYCSISLNIDKWGLRPSYLCSGCHRRYIATFGLIENKLVLKDLETNDYRAVDGVVSESTPKINDIAPKLKKESGFNDLEYKNVNLPISHTGTVVLNAGHIVTIYGGGNIYGSDNRWWRGRRIYEAVIELTFENGILKSEKDRSQEMAAIIHIQSILAAVRKDVKVIRSLVSKGVDVNIKDWEGCTPLHVVAATEKENIEIVKFLVSKGADVNAEMGRRDARPDIGYPSPRPGLTPLHLAAERGNIKTVKFLVANGADVNVKAEYARFFLDVEKRGTPLDIAKDKGHTAVVEYLSSLK